MSSRLQLIGSKTSPYTRRLRLLLYGRAEFEFKIVNYLEIPEDAAYLKSVSPINKLPVLVDDDVKVFESRVIANYLGDKFLWNPLTIEEENVLSMVDAANDVSVNLFLLRRGGLDLNTDNWYIQRQKERLPAIFDHLEPWAKSRDPQNPAHWNYVTMSLLSYVDWADFRSMADFSKYPGLLDFARRFSQKAGVTETSPRQ